MMTECDRVSGGSRTGPAPCLGLHLLLQARTTQVGEWTEGHMAEVSERGLAPAFRAPTVHSPASTKSEQ